MNIKEYSKSSNQRIKELKLIKDAVEKLPTNNKYMFEEETAYLRSISSILPLMRVLRHEEIRYIISEASFKKIVSLFIKATQNK